MIKIIKKIYHKLTEKCWGIGIIEESPQNVMSTVNKSQIKWVKNPYKDCWFADPFILRSDENFIVLLVEEFSYKRRVGRIARIVVDRHYMTIIEFKIILELETHLSFPFIIEKSGEILVVPENYKSGVQSLYSYNEKTHILELKSTLSQGKFTDAVFFNLKGKWLMISTAQPNPNGNVLKYFTLTDDLLINSEKNEFHFGNKAARNGGAIFKIGEKIYRPAQICDERYGEGIELQEIDVKGDEIVGFIPIKRILPTSKRYNLGLHTFNISPDNKNLIVIDGHGYRYPFLGNILEKFVQIIR